MSEFTPEELLQIARECLRQLYQILDAGGLSCRRSVESLFVEGAMKIIPSDYRYAKLADENPSEFLELLERARYEINHKEYLKDKEEYKRKCSLEN